MEKHIRDLFEKYSNVAHQNDTACSMLVVAHMIGILITKINSAQEEPMHGKEWNHINIYGRE